MTRVTSLLNELTSVLSVPKIRGFGPQLTQLRKLRVTKDGALKMWLTNGQERSIPRLGGMLTENVLFMVTRVARELKNRGLISGVFDFFKLLSLVMILIAIASVILIILGGKYLWDMFTQRR